MTQEEVLYNKRCLELLHYKCVTPDDKDFRIYEGKNSVIPSMVDANFNDGFLNNWNWIMTVVDAIEELGSYTIMSITYKGDFEIKRYGVKFYFAPNNKNLLQLELVPFMIDNTFKHPMFKYHIIENFDFKNRSKKEAVVQAINQFLIWYEQNKTK